MGVADALAGLLDPVETPRRSGVQTPKRSDAQTPKRADAWAAKAETARRLNAQTPKSPGVAKSQNPNYAKKTLYILKSTMRDALRKYQDGGDTEESELVEMLLREYVTGKR